VKNIFDYYIFDYYIFDWPLMIKICFIKIKSSQSNQVKHSIYQPKQRKISLVFIKI